MAYIEFRGICKSYDGVNQVLKSIDLDVEKGELVTLLGPSGCGKSTLLRSLAGLEDISSGQIILDGEDITNTPVQKRCIGMVFQQYSLFQNMNVEDNIAFGLKIAKMDKNEIDKKVKAAIERAIPASCPAVSSSVWRLPVPLSWSQRCCCWMNH